MTHTPNLTLVSTHRAVTGVSRAIASARVDNTHRVMIADAAAEQAQIEEYEPRVYTGDEVLSAFVIGGTFGAFVTVGLAFIWSLVLA